MVQTTSMRPTTNSAKSKNKVSYVIRRESDMKIISKPIKAKYKAIELKRAFSFRFPIEKFTIIETLPWEN